MSGDGARSGAVPAAGGREGPGGSRLRVRTVEILPHEVVLIDQLALPQQERYVHCRTWQEVAARITSEIEIPTIGIGAGPDCDGQVLVFHDVVGLCPGLRPSFVKQYADLWTPAREALSVYCTEVRAGTFPAPAQTRRMAADELAEFAAQTEYGDA